MEAVKNRWLKKGYNKAGHGKAAASYQKKAGCPMVRYSGFFHGENQADPFLGSMGKRS